MEPWIIIVLIGCGIILFAGIFNRNASDTSSQTKLLASMEDTLDHFAMEIEEENKMLLEHVKSLKEQLDEKNSNLLHKVEFLEKQMIERQPIRAIRNVKKVKQVIEEQRPESEINAPASNGIKQRYKDIFELHEKGKSIDYIAKQLKMNKGELMLILQLAQQEEQARV